MVTFPPLQTCSSLYCSTSLLGMCGGPSLSHVAGSIFGMPATHYLLCSALSNDFRRFHLSVSPRRVCRVFLAVADGISRDQRRCSALIILLVMCPSLAPLLTLQGPPALLRCPQLHRPQPAESPGAVPAALQGQRRVGPGPPAAAAEAARAAARRHALHRCPESGVVCISLCLLRRPPPAWQCLIACCLAGAPPHTVLALPAPRAYWLAPVALFPASRP